MQFLGLFSSAEDTLREISAWICNFLYSIISWLYELFINISRVEILTSNDIKPIYQRITMILTIVMVFYVTFEAIKYVIEPDQFTDKEKGGTKLVTRMILVVVYIAFVPTVFSLAYKFQNAIFDNQVFSKVILGKQNVDSSTFGRNFSANIFGMFYYVDTNTWPDEELDCDGVPCEVLVNVNLNSLVQYGEMPLLTTGLNEKGNNPNAGTGKNMKSYYIYFNGLFAIGVGAFITYMLVLYCVDAGVRVAQLAFLQIIAPIPIIGYLAPKKDGIFEKWMKQCITTYLDLFLRVGIIYFVLLVCQILSEAYTSGTLINNIAGETSSMMKTLIYIALVMGLLGFAKKAPKMLQELFPNSGSASGNFGLSLKERTRALPGLLKGTTRVAGAVAGGAIGGLGGALQGAAQGYRRSKSLNKKTSKAKGVGAGLLGAAGGFVGGLVGGTGRGLYNGGKKGNVLKNSTAGVKKQFEANQRFGNRQENGYGIGDQIGDRARSMLNMNSRTQSLEKEKDPIKQHDTALKKVLDTRSAIEKRALDKINESGGKNGVAASKYAAAQSRLKQLQDDAGTREKEFKVARFTDEKKAQEAYDAEVTLAKASINKDNFVDKATGRFDKVEYDKAVAASTSRINASDFSVAFRSEEEAQRAYEAAKQAKRATVDRSKYTDEASFEKACQEAEATITKDLYTKGYATQEEADEAYGKEIAKQRALTDDLKDAAVAEYVNLRQADGTLADGDIAAKLASLSVSINEYNQTAEKDRKIEYTDNLDGHGAIDTEKIANNFKGFSDFVKKDDKGIVSNMNKNERKTISIDSEIARIKAQQEGSGINEGKKS